MNRIAASKSNELPVSPSQCMPCGQKVVYPVETGDGDAVPDDQEEVQEEMNAGFRTRAAGPAFTKAEREEHEELHISFRGWCTLCCRARGVATAHKSRRVPGDILLPSISLDYCFLEITLGIRPLWCWWVVTVRVRRRFRMLYRVRELILNGLLSRLQKTSGA